MMVALTAAKGSPGVTASALAMTLAWPGRCLLAECDPAGGDVLAGFLQGALPAQRGLAQLAVAQLRGQLASECDRQLIDLDSPHRQRLLLPGVTEPAQSATVASVWDAVAEHLRERAASGWQVLVDAGRLTTEHFGWPVLRRADRVLLVVRGTLSSVSAAVPALRKLRDELPGGASRCGLLVVEVGPYPAGEVGQRLGADVLAILPADAHTAWRLTTGGVVHRRAPLLRAAAATHLTLAQRRDGSGASEWPVEVAGAV
jgi:hypothetical protein